MHSLTPYVSLVTGTYVLVNSTQAACQYVTHHDRVFFCLREVVTPRLRDLVRDDKYHVFGPGHTEFKRHLRQILHSGYFKIGEHIYPSLDLAEIDALRMLTQTWGGELTPIEWGHSKLENVVRPPTGEHPQRHSIYLAKHDLGVEVCFVPDNECLPDSQGQGYAGKCWINPKGAPRMPFLEFITQVSLNRIELTTHPEVLRIAYDKLHTNERAAEPVPNKPKRKTPVPKDVANVVERCSNVTCGQEFNIYRKSFDGICGDCAGGGALASLDARIEAVRPKESERRGPWMSPAWDEDY